MLLCSGVSVSVWVAIAWNIVIAGTLTQLLADLEWLPGPIAGPWANNRQFFVLVTSGCVLLPLLVMLVLASRGYLGPAWAI